MTAEHVLFYKYFHGDNGAGLGASHQTGWTGVIARTSHLFATSTPESILTVEGHLCPKGRGTSTGLTSAGASRMRPRCSTCGLKRSANLHPPLRVFTQAQYSTIAG